MFDPFGDAAARGYLRNAEGLADLELVKLQEHLFFTANLEQAMDYLAPRSSPDIDYATFLAVHRILFHDFYPWAGQDRQALGVAQHVAKGERVQFEQSGLARRAVEHGLRLAADHNTMRAKPGTIMGYFAWGHPFLDGNGRTMLLVHTELCSRAGFAIDWTSSPKNAYLEALTAELATPEKGILDAYFAPLMGPYNPHAERIERILNIQGLNGLAFARENIAYRADDPAGPEKYQEMVRQREASQRNPIR
nr:Fic family protein [uncultured Duganella sp.]